MFRSLRIAGLVLAAAVLGACSTESISAPAAQVQESVSVRNQVVNVQVNVGNPVAIFVTTTVMGRDVATLADTTVVTLDSKIATAKRAAWNQNYGFDPIAGMQYVQISELYFVTGVAVGSTTFVARSAINHAAMDTSLVKVVGSSVPTKG